MVQAVRLITHRGMEWFTGSRVSGIRSGSGLREGYAGYEGHGTGRPRGGRRAVQRAECGEWSGPNPPDNVGVIQWVLLQICYMA